MSKQRDIERVRELIKELSEPQKGFCQKCGKTLPVNELILVPHLRITACEPCLDKLLKL